MYYTIDELLARMRDLYTSREKYSVRANNPERSESERVFYRNRHEQISNEIAALFGQLDTRISTGEMPTDWKLKTLARLLAEEKESSE